MSHNFFHDNYVANNKELNFKFLSVFINLLDVAEIYNLLSRPLFSRRYPSTLNFQVSRIVIVMVMQCFMFEMQQINEPLPLMYTRIMILILKL